MVRGPCQPQLLCYDLSPMHNHHFWVFLKMNTKGERELCDRHHSLLVIYTRD